MIKKKFPSIFNPGAKGVRKLLGELESEIMEIVWKKDEVTVREIYESLLERKKIAYTTVMTTMSRLADKCVLLKKSEKIAHIYKAASTKNEFKESTTKNILKSLLDEFPAPVISQFVQDLNDIKDEDLDKREKLIKQKRKNKNV